jgi:peptidylprolyl isomerase
MAQAKNGDTVKVHFTGKLEDGTVFASSRQSEPLEFKLGQGKILSGVEEAVEGMTPGNPESVRIPADQAYGQRKEELVQNVSRQELPDNVELKVGQQLRIDREGQEPLTATVVGVSGDSVTLDANHPLAGEDLTFELELIEII